MEPLIPRLFLEEDVSDVGERGRDEDDGGRGHPRPPHESGHWCTVGVDRDTAHGVARTSVGWMRPPKSASPTEEAKAKQASIVLTTQDMRRARKAKDGGKWERTRKNGEARRKESGAANEDPRERYILSEIIQFYAGEKFKKTTELRL